MTSVIMEMLVFKIWSFAATAKKLNRPRSICQLFESNLFEPRTLTDSERAQRNASDNIGRTKLCWKLLRNYLFWKRCNHIDPLHHTTHTHTNQKNYFSWAVFFLLSKYRPRNINYATATHAYWLNKAHFQSITSNLVCVFTIVGHRAHFNCVATLHILTSPFIHSFIQRQFFSHNQTHWLPFNLSSRQRNVH